MRLIPRPIALLLLGLAATAAVTAPGTSARFSFGPPDEHAAQAPYYDNCTACHADYELNSGNGGMSIQGVPAVYTPGATYPIQVIVGDQGQSRWGFELVAQDRRGDGAGTLENLAPGTQLGFAGTREFWKHDLSGTSAGVLHGPVSWEAEWTAPAAGTGTVYFYAAGNAANHDDGTDGDFVYNAAVASAESGSGHPDASSLPQPNRYSHQRGVDRLKAQLRVTNHLDVEETYAVATRVKLPNGNLFPGVGYLTVQFLTLGPGETGSLYFNKPLKATSPVGFYELQMLVGRAPNTLIDIRKVEFEVY